MMDIQSFATDDFVLEHLTDSKGHRQLLDSFSVANNATGLEMYLKSRAMLDETRNESRTYLVKDVVSGELACYFSLRTGLITVSAGDGSFDTVPAAELSNFAVNASYSAAHRNVRKIGAYVFNKFILPVVRSSAGWIGMQCLYVYALPKGKLISYYERLGFRRMSDEDVRFVYSHVKPRYDQGCVFMYMYV